MILQGNDRTSFDVEPGQVYRFSGVIFFIVFKVGRDSNNEVYADLIFLNGGGDKVNSLHRWIYFGGCERIG